MKKQRGFVLIMALIMLMIMSMLAIQSTSTAAMEQRMAGNYQVLLQNEQYAVMMLMDCQTWVLGQGTPPGDTSLVWTDLHAPEPTPEPWCDIEYMGMDGDGKRVYNLMAGMSGMTRPALVRR